MPELPLPSRELAAKLLSELSYEEKLVAWEVESSSGWMQCFLYSLKAAADFLSVDTGGFMRFIDPEEMHTWVKETLRDSDLAQAMAKLLAEWEACQDSVVRYQKEVALIQPMKELLTERLVQCKEVLGV